MTEILQQNHTFARSHHHSKTHKPGPDSHLPFGKHGQVHVHIWAYMQSDGGFVRICTHSRKTQLQGKIILPISCSWSALLGTTDEEFLKWNQLFYLQGHSMFCKYSAYNADIWTVPTALVMLVFFFKHIPPLVRYKTCILYHFQTLYSHIHSGRWFVLA